VPLLNVTVRRRRRLQRRLRRVPQSGEESRTGASMARTAHGRTMDLTDLPIHHTPALGRILGPLGCGGCVPGAVLELQQPGLPQREHRALTWSHNSVPHSQILTPKCNGSPVMSDRTTPRSRLSHDSHCVPLPSASLAMSAGGLPTEKRNILGHSRQ
jgi:hypothetical protein